MAGRTWRSTVLLTALAAAPALTLGMATAAAAAPAPFHGRQLSITTISNARPDLVSGGQVLVAVNPPSGRHSRVSVTENGHDITAKFHRRADGSLLGLVTGLREGTNTLRATTEHGMGHRFGRSQQATLRVTNHPITGPVFSGSQQLPFFCQTQAFGLAPAQQPYCSAPTKVSYEYRTTAGKFAPLADPATRPVDLATTTVNGRSVPYVIRIERGTIDAYH
ncbi:MAG: DUF6351 family protein, partial [Sciscionella sp.]